jgi:hypothetical protein
MRSRGTSPLRWTRVYYAFEVSTPEDEKGSCYDLFLRYRLIIFPVGLNFNKGSQLPTRDSNLDLSYSGDMKHPLLLSRLVSSEAIVY